MKKESSQDIAAAVLYVQRLMVWHKRWRNLSLLLIGLIIIVSLFIPEAKVNRDHIALININEPISQDSYFWDQFDRINFNDTKAVLVLMNSPGGTVGDSERLYNQIRLLQRNIPLSLLVENYATSGGYLGSLGADRIYAYNSSLIGSIGVVLQNWVLNEVYEKIGIKVETITTGSYKGYPSSAETMPAKVRQHYQDLLDSDNSWFLSLVTERRGLDKSQVDAIKNAQVYSALDAIPLGLIDGISTREEQIELLRQQVGNLPVKDMAIDEEDVLGLSKLFKTPRRSIGRLFSALFTPV